MLHHWIVSLIWITDWVYRRPFPSLAALEATLSIQPADKIQALLPFQTSAAYEMRVVYAGLKLPPLLRSEPARFDFVPERLDVSPVTFLKGSRFPSAA